MDDADTRVTNSALKKIAKGTSIAFIAIFFGRLFSYLYILLLSKLGPEQYGALNLGFAILIFLLMFSTLGFRMSIIRFVSYNLGKKDNERIKGAIVDPLKLTLFLSLLYSVALFVFSPQIANLFVEPLLIPILRGLAIALPFFATGTLFLAAIIGFKKGHLASIIREVVGHGLTFILMLFAFILGYGFYGAIFSYVIGMIFVCFLAVYYLERKLFTVFSNKVKTKHYFKTIFLYSWPLALFTILSLVMNKIDVLMLGFFKTTDVVGIYSIALATATLMVVIPIAFTSLFLPISTEAYAKHQNFKRLFEIVNNWIFFILFSAFLFIAVFSKEFLLFVFGEAYVSGWLALSILAFGYFIFGFNYNTLNILQTLKKTKTILFVTVSAATFNIILNITLIPPYGMLGGAIATTGAYVFMFLLSSALLFRFTKLKPVKKLQLKGVLAALISFSIIFLISKYISITLISFILLIFLYLGLLVIMFYLVKAYEKEELELLRSFIKKHNLTFLAKIFNR